MKRIAGELDSSHVGKVISVTYVHGNITSTVRDVVEKIIHERDGVRLHFRSTKWNTGGFGLITPLVDLGLLVALGNYVEIQE